MPGSRVLVVFYSRGGNTQRVAQEIARACGECDVEMIRDDVERRGIRGYLLSGYQALRRQLPALRPPEFDPTGYELVVVGTPVWASSVSAPVRSYLSLHAERLGKVAFFLTHGSSGRSRVFRQMTELVGRRPVATLAVRERELRRGSFVARAQDFAAQIASTLARERTSAGAPGIAA